MKRQKLFIIFPLLIMIVLLGATACSAAEPETIYVTQMVEKEVVVEGEMIVVTEIVEVEVQAPRDAPESLKYQAEDLDEEGKAGNDYAANRMIIMNAEVSLVVNDPADKADEIIRMAINMGGWVVQSNVYALETDTKRIFNAQITVRVPISRLNEALDIIKDGAIEIVYDNKSGQDVTEAYTDTDSRKRNLEETADKLREILANAKNTDEALDILDTLNGITEQIEVLKGKLKYYSESSAMSSISVSLEAPLVVYTPTPTMTPTPTLAPTSAVWNPGATASTSLTTLTNFIQNLVDFLIRIVLLWLPILLVFILPVVFVLWFINYLNKRKKRKVEEARQKIHKEKEEASEE